MTIKLASVAYLRAANSGYGVGLDDDGHRVEFLYDWPTLDGLVRGLREYEPHYVEVQERQIVAVDDEPRLPLSRETMAERTAFIRAALAEQAEPE